MHSKRRKPLFYLQGRNVHRPCRMRRSDVNSYTNTYTAGAWIHLQAGVLSNAMHIADRRILPKHTKRVRK